MATETKFHLQNPQSISEMLDHGSISFGRFAAESLAWEKWSVFSHNRCQEELEKFKAPGFVAQKKAFFEEYYKKLRAIKALQADQVGSVNDDSIVEEERKSSCFSSVQTLDNVASTESDVSSEDIEKKQELDSVDVISNLSCKNATTRSSCSTEPDEPTKKHTSSKTRNSIIIASSVKNTSNTSKSQGSCASSGSITKMGTTSKKDGFKSSEKLKPSPRDKKVAVKKDISSIEPRKITSCKAANANTSNCGSSRKKPSELCPVSTVRITSSARNRLVSPSPNGNIGQTKTKSNQRDSTRRSIPSNLQSSQRSSKESGSDDFEQKKGTDRSNTKVERTSIFVPTTSLSNHKSIKPVHKNITAQSTNLALARKVELRPKTPGWR